MVVSVFRELTRSKNAQQDLEEQIEQLMEENSQLRALRSDLSQQQGQCHHHSVTVIIALALCTWCVFYLVYSVIGV